MSDTAKPAILDRLQWPIAIVLIALGTAWVADDWDGFTSALGRFHPVVPLVATAMLMSAMISEAWGWRTLMAGFGQRLPPAAALRTWILSQLGQYLPGTVWFAAGRVWMATRLGASPYVTTTVVALDAVMWVGLGLILALVLAPLAGLWIEPGSLTPVLAVVAALLAGAWAIPSVRALVRGKLNDLSQLAPHAKPVGAVLRTGGLQLLAWSLDAGAFVVLARNLFGLEGFDLLRAAAVFQTAGLTGTLVFVVPNGIGPQETLLVQGMRQVPGAAGATPGELAALAVAMRACTVLSDALVTLGALLFTRAPAES